MITFDSLTLKAFIEEQKNFFVGGKINKIQQPTRREILLTVRNNRETKQLYINIDPQTYHICFSNKENLERKNIEIPQKPPMFCMLLRKYLNNSTISKVNQPENERIFEIYFDTYNEFGEKTYLCLAIEFMGKYSNVILYNYDTNIILGCAHNVGPEKSRARELFGTIPYAYPPKQVKQNILNYNGNIENLSLSKEFYYISPAFEQMIKKESLEKIKSYIKLENIQPAISKDFTTYSLYQNLLPEKNCINTTNEMIDNYYSYHIEQIKIKNIKSNYLSVINSKLKKTTKTLKQMDYQISKNNNSDKYRLYGDLIMANLYNLKDFSEKIIVFDYENNQDIEITLDNTKTLKDNANNFYKLYTKSKTSNEKLKNLHTDLTQTKIYLESLLYSINISNTIKELLELKEEIPGKSEESANIKPSIEPEKIILNEQTTIYIGKNNKQNNYIISKLADENDLWFHVKDYAGSHVLLKSQAITEKLIYECAKLAKQYSSVANSTKAGIIYTKKKYIKKPPKANLGYVTYRNEKEIIV